MAAEELREIPPVDRLLADCVRDLPGVPRPLLTRAVRETLEELRRTILEQRPGAEYVRRQFADGAFAHSVTRRLNCLQQPRHRRVINGTGVLLHTGLGRAPLADSAVAAMTRIARYGVVEVDPTTGLRGRRELFVRDLLCELTGAEEAIVVNNNAAAVLLLLRGIAKGKEVIVSRGELVEIGGGFRVPAVMEESGARLVEVGTTNRTRIADYAAAMSPNTALLLQVHRSNFKMVGFTELPAIKDLVLLGRERGVRVACDQGSGYLRRFPGLPFLEEPTVQEILEAHVDLVTFSGDKMLGGPQCGILLGRRDLVLSLRDQPLFRALRPDKVTLAALEATLLEYRGSGEEAPARVLFYRQMSATRDELCSRAQKIVDGLGATSSVAIVNSKAQVGSGSVPGLEFDSIALSISAPGSKADRFAERLRAAEPSVFARVVDDQVLIDLRTVFDEEDSFLIRVLRDLNDFQEVEDRKVSTH